MINSRRRPAVDRSLEECVHVKVHVEDMTDVDILYSQLCTYQMHQLRDFHSLLASLDLIAGFGFRDGAVVAVK